ncbi:transcription initiation factor TFIID subunit 13-like [Andrographis paniculata]|uniref:transcription initiation factor TFIID subunit 13-like n=1 Tax=Andrographis paniculata TaxID=175694 RepID=UPI0021E9A37D|nr:transcription initiation factor TFIID subunit 13-like [Andrographis paniculata]
MNILIAVAINILINSFIRGLTEFFTIFGDSEHSGDLDELNQPCKVFIVKPISPLPMIVSLVEDIVVEYVTDTVHKTEDVASKRGKLLTEDFLFLIGKNFPKLNRCTELLSMNEELKQARKTIDVEKLAYKE